MLTASYCRPQRIGSQLDTAIEHHVAKRCNLYIYILVCKSTTQFLSLFILCALTFSLPCGLESEELHALQSSKRADVVFVDRFPGVQVRQTLLGPQHTKVGCRHLTSRRELRQQHTQAQWFLQKVLSDSLSRGSWNLHCQVMGTGITRHFDPMILKQPGVRHINC